MGASRHYTRVFHLASRFSSLLRRRHLRPIGGWLYEVKHDGHRLAVIAGGGEVRLLSRNGYERTKQFGAVFRLALSGERSGLLLLLMPQRHSGVVEKLARRALEFASSSDTISPIPGSFASAAPWRSVAAMATK